MCIQMYFFFSRLTWTPLMSVTWTVSFSFRRSMLESLKHRYIWAKTWHVHTHTQGWAVLTVLLLMWAVFTLGGQGECLTILSFCKYHCLPWQHYEVRLPFENCSLSFFYNWTQLHFVSTLAPTITWSFSENLFWWWTPWITEVFTRGRELGANAVNAGA